MAKTFWTRHRRAIAVVAWSILLVLFGAALFGKRSLLRYHQLQQEKQRIEASIEAKKLKNRALMRELDALRNDKAYQERLAREELNFVRPGEIVYRFPDTPAPSQTPNAPSTRASHDTAP